MKCKIMNGGKKDFLIIVLKFVFSLKQFRVEQLQNIEIK